MRAEKKQLTDKQAERKARLYMFVIGVIAFALGVFLKMTAKDHAITWPEGITTLVELIAWPFWIGGFLLILLGLGMKTGKDK